MKILKISMVAATLITLLNSCSDKALEIEGQYIDSYKIDKMEVRKVEGNHYTVGNKISQLHLQREGNSLLGVTPLGDSVSMIFHPDSAEYHIMGTLTIYHQTGPLDNKE